jgi:hypothetical protein
VCIKQGTSCVTEIKVSVREAAIYALVQARISLIFYENKIIYIMRDVVALPRMSLVFYCCHPSGELLLQTLWDRDYIWRGQSYEKQPVN